MKNGKLKYILIAIVLGIWSTIIYRYIAYLKGNDYSKQYVLNNNNTNFNQNTDTFTLYANYSNPFIGINDTKQGNKSSSNNDVHKIVTKPKIVPINTITWPSIKYSGIVFNTKNNRNSVMLTINGKIHILEKDGSIMGIKIIAVKKDSIALLYLNQQKYFKIYESK